MPIPNDAINRECIQISTDDTVRHVRDALPLDKRRITFFIARLDAERFSVFRYTDLILFFQSKSHTPDPTMLDARLSELDNFLQFFARPAFDQNQNTVEQAKAAWTTPMANPPVVTRGG